MKRLFGKYFLWFAGANLASFLLYYISSYILGIDAVEYVRYFICEAIDFALPVVAAALGAAAMGRFGFKGLLVLPFASLGRLVYAFPYFYLYFVEGGLLSSEALILAVPFSLGAALLDCIAVGFLSFIIYTVASSMAKKRGLGYSECAESVGAPFDFSSEFTVAVFSVGGIVFVINLAIEIFETVSYVLGYSGAYRLGEIVYIVVSFIMILVELIIGQYVAVTAAKRSKEIR